MVKTQLFYFSATGNSLALARHLAEALGETELLSIPEMIHQSVKADAPRIGFVFPVYAYGLPRMVTDFVKKLKLNREQYVFAISTSGGTPAGTLLELKKMIRKCGGELNAGFNVRDAGHSPLTTENALIRFMMNIAGPKPDYGQNRLDEIAGIIKGNRQHKLERSSWMANTIGGALHKFAIQSFRSMDGGFWTDTKCNGCHSCERVCPRRNIKMENGRPVWQHNCEYCFACLNWCPQKAVQYKQETLASERSHHSEVKLGDVLLR